MLTLRLALPVGSLASLLLLGAPGLLRAQEAAAQAYADEALAKLTLEEKISLCHGDGTMSINAIPKIGLNDRFWLSDGPNNVNHDLQDDSFRPRGKDTDPNQQSTSLPRLSLLARTWNHDLARLYGGVLGAETRARGKDMILGPGVNIVRTPLNGRNFEYLSEDPYLNARLAVADIEAIQSRAVAACVKHFALNNQELNRLAVNVEVDDRTLHEIYLPAFDAAVREAHVLAVMGAYNRFRGEFCCQNDLLLNKILKQQWAFPGLVVSDWGGTHDTLKAARGGLDLEMHAGASIKYFRQPLLDAVNSGAVPLAVIDDKVRRILYVMAAIHKIDGQDRRPGSLNTPEHQDVARAVAEEGIVLLKNDHALLPLDRTKLKRLLVVGANAQAITCSVGGSSAGNPPYEITPLEGLQRLLGPGVKIDVDAQAILNRAPTKDDAPVDLKKLAAKAKDYDAVLAFTGNHVGGGEYGEEEGHDRTTINLPPGTTEAVEALLKANRRTVVINLSGAPVAMPWADKAPALVQYGMAGMEGGNALARVLFGEVNPSGKLAVTFPKRLADSPAHALGAYNDKSVPYAEGLLVGYRWFDAKGLEPLFPFGYGLSYTSFALSHLKLSAPTLASGQTLSVTVDLANTGKRSGSEVVQLYVQAPTALAEPPHQLKGFEKIMLLPGDHKPVTFALTAQDLAHWDTAAAAWKTSPGTYTLLVGNSSRHLPLTAKLTVKD